MDSTNTWPYPNVHIKIPRQNEYIYYSASLNPEFAFGSGKPDASMRSVIEVGASMPYATVTRDVERDDAPLALG